MRQLTGDNLTHPSAWKQAVVRYPSVFGYAGGSAPAYFPSGRSTMSSR